MFVSFMVVESHPLAKGLNGGRFRHHEGEPLIVGLLRRVAQDTRTQVLAHAEEPAGSRRYRLTLRGTMGRGQQGEGAIVVALRGARSTSP